MKKIVIIIISFCNCFLVCCNTKKKNNIFQKLVVDSAMLDSIKRIADTTYIKKYPRTDLTTAEYFRTDSTITQLMRDSTNIIRQVSIVKNKTRVYFAQYYANGQLMGKYNLDSFGQYNGPSTEYYENGSIKATGNYMSGLHSGNWKIYDNEGNYISMIAYNKDGQEITPVK